MGPGRLGLGVGDEGPRRAAGVALLFSVSPHSLSEDHLLVQCSSRWAGRAAAQPQFPTEQLLPAFWVAHCSWAHMSLTLCMGDSGGRALKTGFPFTSHAFTFTV